MRNLHGLRRIFSVFYCPYDSRTIVVIHADCAVVSVFVIRLLVTPSG